jgi:hypothetical protein
MYTGIRIAESKHTKEFTGQKVKIKKRKTNPQQTMSHLSIVIWVI